MLTSLLLMIFRSCDVIDGAVAVIDIVVVECVGIVLDG